MVRPTIRQQRMGGASALIVIVVSIVSYVVVGVGFPRSAWSQQPPACTKLQEVKTSLVGLSGNDLQALSIDFPEVGSGDCLDNDKQLQAVLRTLGEPLVEAVEKALNQESPDDLLELSEFLVEAEQECRRAENERDWRLTAFQGWAEEVGSAVDGKSEIVRLAFKGVSGDTFKDRDGKKVTHWCSVFDPVQVRLTSYAASILFLQHVREDIGDLQSALSNLENRVDILQSGGAGAASRGAKELVLIAIIVGLVAFALWGCFFYVWRGKLGRRGFGIAGKSDGDASGASEGKSSGETAAGKHPYKSTGTEPNQSGASRVGDGVSSRKDRQRTGQGELLLVQEELQKELQAVKTRVKTLENRDEQAKERQAGAAAAASDRTWGRHRETRPDDQHGATSVQVSNAMPAASMDSGNSTQGGVVDDEWIASMEQRIQGVERKVKSSQERKPEKVVVTPSPPTKPNPEQEIEKERKLLEKGWEMFRSEKSGYPELAEEARRFTEPTREKTLMQRLKGVPLDLEGHRELRISAVSSLAEMESHLRRMEKLSLVPQLLGEGGARFASSSKPETQILRLRDAQQLLLLLQTTDLPRKMLDFDLRAWIRKDFLQFADDFLRKEAQADDKEGPFLKVREVVRETLAYADLEPVPIVLGQTPFDSKVHIGRSDATERGVPDGVVVGIVQTGFKDRRTGKMLQRPEVVVNRV